MASNNPYRKSMTPPSFQDIPSAPSPLQKTYSSASTIVGQRESEDMKGTETMTRQTTITDSARNSDEDPLKTDHFVITINDDPSQLSIQTPAPASCNNPNRLSRMSKRCSGVQTEENGKWRSMKAVHQRANSSKRKRMIIKIIIALVIVIGAAAIGLGISKAVHDANNK